MSETWGNTEALYYLYNLGTKYGKTRETNIKNFNVAHIEIQKRITINSIGTLDISVIDRDEPQKVGDFLDKAKSQNLLWQIFR